MTTVEELVAAAADLYGVDPEAMEPFLLAGRPALIGDWEQSIGNTQHVGRIVFLVHEGLGYVVTNLARPEECEGFTAFTPPEGQAPYDAPYVAVLAGEDNIVQELGLEGPPDEDGLIAALAQPLDADIGEPIDSTFSDLSGGSVTFEAAQQGVDIAGTLVPFLETPQPFVVLAGAPSARREQFTVYFATMESSPTTADWRREDRDRRLTRHT